MLIKPGEFNSRMQQISQEIRAAKLVVTNRKWWAYLSGDQLNITNTTWVKIQFDTNWADFSCETGFSSYGYLVPERGMYLVELYVTWKTGTIAANATYYAAFFKDAAIMVYVPNYITHTGYVTEVVTAIVPADAGDVIYGYCYHDNGTNDPDLLGAAYSSTHMQIHLLSRRCT